MKRPIDVVHAFTRAERVAFFAFLDELVRERGSINIYALTPIFAEKFGLSIEDARAIRDSWTEVLCALSPEYRVGRAEEWASHEGRC
jgi:hypothetical protein